MRTNSQKKPYPAFIPLQLNNNNNNIISSNKSSMVEP